MIKAKMMIPMTAAMIIIWKKNHFILLVILF